MKKHFLIFTALFMAFETYFVTASSSSLSINLEFEESNKSIVIFNPQGQKVRKIPLYQQEDPCADNRLQRYGRAPIIILLGTSTAGKTTLIDSIKKKYTIIKDYSTDIVFYNIDGDIIKCSFPQEYAIIHAVTPHENISKICDDGDKIKEGVHSPKQIQLAEGAAQKIRDTLKEYSTNKKIARHLDFKRRHSNNIDQLISDSMKGIPIILDYVRLKDLGKIFSRNFFAETNIIISFCPLKELSKRLTKRNEEAKLYQQFSNARSGGFPLWQFTELYRKRESQEEPLLQLLTRKEALRAFSIHIAKPEKERIFLQALGFTSPEVNEVEITSCAPYYHAIWNTKTGVYTRIR